MTGSTFHISSKYLKRVVKAQILQSSGTFQQTPVTLIFNDGQDFNALKMAQTMQAYEAKYPEIPFVIIGIEAGDRINEYGTVYKNDYKNRGNKAIVYNDFIIRELLPYVKSEFNLTLDPSMTGFAGFSLGGLSAIDITFHNPDVFGFCGVFSGSFWWRYKPFSEEDPDGCRILHEYIDKHPIKVNQRFWFQAGTHDEECDRNGNGVIDAIDDTLDIIRSLEKKGYVRGKNISYHEVFNGTHDPYTWGKAMPVFFDWVLQPIKGNTLSKMKTA